jgi:chemotaxis protein histidine kinase CheA
MDQIQKAASAARRRLITSRFLEYLPYSLGSFLLLASVGVLLPKWMVLPVDSSIWYGSWLISALGLGLLVNAVMTWLGRPSIKDAAVEVDRRFGLRERLSSALSLSEEDRQTKLGQALVVDANRRAEALDIPSQFQWGLHRGLLLPFVPGLLSLLFFAIADRTPEVAQQDKPSLSATQVRNSTQPMLEQVRKKREEAEKQDLMDLAEMYKRLEGELEKMREQPPMDPKEALAKLNDIKDQLNDRKKELGSSEALKKNLQNLEKFESGPADKLAEALKKGDFEQAEQALDELLKKIQGKQLDPSDLEKLGKQLEQMEQALKQTAEAHEKAKQNLQEQLRKAQESGDAQQAGELQRKLEQMQSADSSMARMQQMADMLSQCKNCMKEGDSEGLQEALSQMASQLSEMNSDDSQLQDLDELMDSLSQCKSGMCDGMRGNKLSEMPGQGLGEGMGEGERPEGEEDVDFFESQVRAQMRMGENIFGGKIGGENRKGVSRVEIQEEISREMASEPEPMDETPLPRNQREHTREYFNQLREGKS